MFWQGAEGQVLIGFLSNLLFILILTAAGVLYVRAVLGLRSRPLHRLLGVGGHLPNKVRIVVSSIYVLKEGALGVRVVGPTGFYGPVMNQSEYVSAQLLRDAIRTRPTSRPLRALLNQLGLLETVHDPTDCEIVLSSQYVDSQDGKPVGADEYQPPDLRGECAVVERIRDSMREAQVYILVGGPAYNANVAYVLADLSGKDARFRFDVTADGAQIVVDHDGGQERYVQQHQELIDAQPTLVDYFVLQKISNYGLKNLTVFICSGLSSLGTAAAVGLLASQWKRLAKDFRGDDFALLYQFHNRRDVAMPTAEDVEKALATATMPPGFDS